MFGSSPGLVASQDRWKKLKLWVSDSDLEGGAWDGLAYQGLERAAMTPLPPFVLCMLACEDTTACGLEGLVLRVSWFQLRGKGEGNI